MGTASIQEGQGKKQATFAKAAKKQYNKTFHKLPVKEYDSLKSESSLLENSEQVSKKENAPHKVKSQRNAEQDLRFQLKSGSSDMHSSELSDKINEL